MSWPSDAVLETVVVPSQSRENIFNDTRAALNCYSFLSYYVPPMGSGMHVQRSQRAKLGTS